MIECWKPSEAAVGSEVVLGGGELVTIEWVVPNGAVAGERYGRR